MKNLILGSAMIMFASSFSADATNQHVISVSRSAEVQKIVYMQAFGETLPPIGYVNFCRENETECAPRGPFADRVHLTAAARDDLVFINDMVNRQIEPVTDMELYGQAEVWTYPHGAGDCEDYVLLKRKLLIDRGWPESTLLITVVRDENNEGHAILTVRTDRGDFVLDNKRPEILAWHETPYSFVKQQSARNPLVWISLVPPGQAPQTPFSASQSNR